MRGTSVAPWRNDFRYAEPPVNRPWAGFGAFSRTLSAASACASEASRVGNWPEKALTVSGNALEVARRRPNTTHDGTGNSGCTSSLIVHASSHAIRALANEPLRNFSNCPRVKAAKGSMKAIRPPSADREP